MKIPAFITLHDGKLRAFVKVRGVWMPRSWYVYARAYGSIQRGNIIHHVNGNSLDDRPSNLASISRRVHDIIENRWRKVYVPKRELESAV